MNEDPTEEQIRDWYAGQVLTGFVAALPWVPDSPDTSRIAQNAFDLADAMMKERKLRQLPE